MNISSSLKNDSLVRGLLFTNVISVIYLIAYLFFGFAEDTLIQEVLKQLITVTALVVTLIYAVIIPRLFFEKEKKSLLIDKYEKDSKMVFVLQQYTFVIINIFCRNSRFHDYDSIRDLYKMYIGTEVAPEKIIEKKFFKKVEKLIFTDEKPIDESSLRLHLYLTSKYNTKWNKELCMLLIYLVEFVRPAGRGLMLNQLVDRIAFSPLELEHLMFSSEGIRNYAYLNDEKNTPMHIAFAENDGMAQFYMSQLKKYREILYAGVISSFDENSFAYTYPWILKGTFDIYTIRINNMVNDLYEILNKYSSKNHRSGFLASCIALLFGVIIPLIALNFKSGNIQPLISALCVQICVGMLISFIIDVYVLFSGDTDELNFKVKLNFKFKTRR